MKGVVVLLVLILALQCSAQCYCPSYGCEGGYSGNEADCYCWAERQATAKRQLGQVGWSPQTSFDLGYCKYCPSGVANGPVVFYIEIGICEDGYYIDSTGVRICNMVCETYNDCLSFCEATARARHFDNGAFTCGFVPCSYGSHGGCSVAGNVDPCTVNAINDTPGLSAWIIHEDDPFFKQPNITLVHYNQNKITTTMTIRAGQRC